MRREWHIRRTGVPHRDGAHRWDHAYQHLLQWVAEKQEGCDASGNLCAGIEQTSGTGPHHRPAVGEHEELSPDQGWELNEEHIYRDDGYSGANLGRPGLDRLRDAAAVADMEVVVMTAPDRFARKYLHQVLLIEELGSSGVQVVFVERPMSEDPNDQLLLQIRGAVAEYERTLIRADAARQAGQVARRLAAALDPRSLRLPGRSRAPTRPRRCPRRPG